jgi:2-amino-4-hydroxy-6-hydroxymethyldihydropteridine diphosphokinase
MTTPVLCYLGLGSNLQNPRIQIKNALQKLSALPSTKVLRHSPWYSSKAMGLDKRPNNNQPDYINGVIEIKTGLEPHELLQALQQIERAQGRTREIRWGARTLDIDILLYGRQRIHSDDLDIPHPRMMERNFVLVPLADLDPSIPLSLLGADNPRTGKNETIASLLDKLPRNDLRLLDEQSLHDK